MRYVIALDGSGDFTSLQAAVDAASPGDALLVRPGVYEERVVVHRDGLRIAGEDGATLTASGCAKDRYPDGREKGTFLSATLLVLGSDVTVENLTVRNDAGDGDIAGQAVAVYAAGDRGVWRDCRLIAHQDTLFCGPVMPKVLDAVAPRTMPDVECVASTGDCPPTRGRQYFENCLIQGDVDFIFGPYRCWFEGCTLRMNARGGWYTAANTPEAQPWGLVFHRCRLTGDCPPGAAKLGRPWRRFARTLFLACDMDEAVSPAGFEDWENWDGIRPVTERCGEWGTTGARADQSTRHPGQKRLTDGEAAEVRRDAVLDGWRPEGRIPEESQGRAAAANPLVELMLRRRSYRGRYKDQPVPRADLAAIMAVGLAAPSGCNKQTTSLIAVDDPALLARLKAEIDPPVAQTAPAVICVLTRRIVAYRDRCFATQDYAAAIENMLLATVALGYASCWYEGHITDTDRIGDRLARALGVPEDYELVCLLPVGIPEEAPAPPKKRPFEERAWFNGFGKR